MVLSVLQLLEGGAIPLHLEALGLLSKVVRAVQLDRELTRLRLGQGDGVDGRLEPGEDLVLRHVLERGVEALAVRASVVVVAPTAWLRLGLVGDETPAVRATNPADERSVVLALPSRLPCANRVDACAQVAWDDQLLLSLVLDAVPDEPAVVERVFQDGLYLAGAEASDALRGDDSFLDAASTNFAEREQLGSQFVHPNHPLHVPAVGVRNDDRLGGGAA